MQPYLSNYYSATRFVLEKRLMIDPIKKPDIYLDIDIDKKQIEENDKQEMLDIMKRNNGIRGELHRKASNSLPDSNQNKPENYNVFIITIVDTL